MMYKHVRLRTWLALGVAGLLGLTVANSVQAAQPINTPTAFDDNLDLENASATLQADSTIVFQQVVKGVAAGTQPATFGTLNGAAVLGHVFPTTLNSSDIGFDADQGTVALAITIHPDFDDTPLADENDDGDFANDGGVIHSHWVVLVGGETEHNGVEVNLIVKPLDFGDPAIARPVTHPGADFPLYIDSPNFFVQASDDLLSVVVPTAAINDQTDFQHGAVTSFLEVHGDMDPLLGVYVVYDILGGSLTPFNIVPEPGTAAVLALGLLGVAAKRRCRRA